MRKELKNFLAALVLFLWIFPLVWLVVTSLKLERNVVTETLALFPEKPTLENYYKAFTSTHILHWMKNSIIVSITTMLLTLAVDAPIAYAFAKIKFPGQSILFWLIMAGMMIPFQVLIIPLYLQLNTYGLINTLAAAILPRLSLPIGVFILKQFFEGIPTELEEAAFIDGSGRFRIFMKIIN